MATLIRTRAAINIQDEVEERRPLHLDIPSPFPRLPHQAEIQPYGTPSVQVNGVGIQKKSGEDEETVEKGEIATVSATQAAEGSQTTGALTSEDTDSVSVSILPLRNLCKKNVRIGCIHLA